MYKHQVDISAQVRCLATSGQWGQWLHIVPGKSSAPRKARPSLLGRCDE